MNRLAPLRAAARAFGWAQAIHPSPSTLWLLAGLMASAGAMAERTITELPPQELPAFVRQHPKVVVQFTSPDTRCGFCVGADKQFTEGVAQDGMDGWKYVRVQWPRWNEMPTFAPPVTVWGVPDHQVYEGGEYKGSGGGRAKSAAALMASIASKMAGPKPTAAAAPTPTPAEMTPEVRNGLRYYALRKVLGGAVHECERQHHGNKPVYAPKLRGWGNLHAAELKLGTQAMFSTLGAKQDPYSDEVTRQAAQVSERLAKGLGIVEGQPATLEQCERLAGSLDTF